MAIAVLLGVYEVGRSISFDYNNKKAIYDTYNDIIQAIEETQDNKYKNEKIIFFYENNYLNEIKLNREGN